MEGGEGVRVTISIMSGTIAVGAKSATKDVEPDRQSKTGNTGRHETIYSVADSSINDIF